MTATLTLAPEDLQTIVDEVWSSMLQSPPVGAGAWGARDADVVAAAVGISGSWTGWVVVETSEEGAVDLAAALLSIEPENLDPADLSDAVGEMANIVGGSVKACLEGVSQLSLPCVARVPVEADPQADELLRVNATWRAHPVRITVRSERHPFSEVRS